MEKMFSYIKFGHLNKKLKKLKFNVSSLKFILKLIKKFPKEIRDGIIWMYQILFILIGLINQHIFINHLSLMDTIKNLQSFNQFVMQVFWPYLAIL